MAIPPYLIVAATFVFALGAVLANDPPPPEIVAKLVQEFFSAKNIHQVVALVCNPEVGIRVLRSFAASGSIQVSASTNVLNLLEVGDARNVLDSRRQFGIVVLPPCSRANHIIEQCVDQTLFNASYHWLLLADDVDFNATCLQTDSEMTVARPLPDDRWLLTEVFRQNPLRDVEFDETGVWDPIRGLSLPLENRVTVKRSNIGDTLVRGVLYTVVNVSSEIMYSVHELPKPDVFQYISAGSVFTHTIFVNSAAKYNMTVQLSCNTHPGQLVSDESGHFMGALGVLERRQADVVCTGLFIYPGRMGVAHFTLPTSKYRSMFMFLNTGVLGSVDALVRPFDWTAWLGISVVAAITVVLFKVMAYFEPLEDEEADFTWGLATMAMFASFTTQGFHLSGTWVSWRTLLFVFNLFVLMSYNYYSSSIVTFLLQAPPTTVRNLKDLVHSPLKGASNPWLHFVRIFKETKDPVIREAYEKLVKPPAGLGFIEVNEGMDAIRYKHAAYFSDDTMLYTYTKNFTAAEICRLREVDLTHVDYVVPAIGKHASVKQYVRVGVVQQAERGISSRLWKHYYEQRPVCNRDSRDAAPAVAMESVLPTIIIMACGVLLGVVFCVTEIARWRLFLRQGRQKRLRKGIRGTRFFLPYVNKRTAL